MPSVILPTLTADEVDDLLYLARTNDLLELKTTISSLAQRHNATITTIAIVAIDPDSGNGILHMAAGNGCMDILDFLLPTQDHDRTHAFQSLEPNLQNLAGNTPLHYAALNSQLSAIKCLVAAGAEPGIKNAAGHDSVFEVERKEWAEGVEYLLHAAGAGEGHQDGEESSKAEVMDGFRSNEVREKDEDNKTTTTEESIKEDRSKIDRPRDALIGMEDLKMEERGK
ncbi:MAG: hypothetical protein Q9222_007854 [Ikaeria aurantiellina]